MFLQQPLLGQQHRAKLMLSGQWLHTGAVAPAGSGRALRNSGQVPRERQDGILSRVYPGKAMAVPSAGVSPAADGRLVWRPCVPFTSLLSPGFTHFPQVLLYQLRMFLLSLTCSPFILRMLSDPSQEDTPAFPNQTVLILQKHLCFQCYY